MLISLLRVHQWYKNLVIFLPILFAAEFLNLGAFWATFLGFISLCLMSSVIYIINDIVDKDKDKKHPEKRNRAIASGKVSLGLASFIAVILGVVSFVLACFLNFYFAGFVLALFIFSLLYTLWLKKVVLVDVLLISVNFVIRAVSGAFVIVSFGPWIRVSPWLLLCTFFLALFLAVSKRKSELMYLGKRSNKIVVCYAKELANSLMIVATTALVLAYALYCIFGIYPGLIYSLPFALYTIFRYVYLVYKDGRLGRRAERAFLDSGLVVGIILWLVSVIIVIY